MGIKMDIYVGTYSLPIQFGTGEIFHGKGKGIYRFEFDTDKAELKLINVTQGVDNSSYIAVNPDARRLYAVNELKEYEGKPSGAVSAYAINHDGTLSFINRLATQGTDPCHVILSPDKKHVIVSNYSGGSISVYPILPDGALGEMAQFIQYEGQSIHPVRQTGPHAHSVAFSADSRFVYVCDLGTDRVRIYRYNDSGLVLSDAGEYVLTPGAGPRLAVFWPDRRYCYVINEMDCTISVAAADSETGALREIQRVSTVPTDTADNLCADLHITSDGRFLYVSNRGLDNIAIFRIDKDTGLLTLVGYEPCGGRTPRSFTLDATGSFVLCANMDSDNIAVFAINKETGALEKKSETEVPTPVCVV